MSNQNSNTKYFKEAFNLLKQCSKNEARQDLATKVYEELISTNTNTIHIMKSCSRELEEFLKFVNSPDIISHLFSRVTEDQLDELIRDRAACFLFEKLLVRLPKLFPSHVDSLRSSFERVFQCICENFDDYISETGPSHIIAATINFLHPSIPKNDDNEFESILDGGRTQKEFIKFSNEWQIEKKLKRLGKLIKQSSKDNELVYATMLRTSGYLRKKLYKKLLDRLWTRYSTELNVEDLFDRHWSFTFEVVLQFPSEQRENVLRPLIIKHIDDLYLHPIGNFLVQQFLLTAETKELVDEMFRSLTDDEHRFEQLVRQGQIRLVITLIRVCERFHCHYEQFIQRLRSLVDATEEEFLMKLLKFRGNSDDETISKDGSLLVQALFRAENVDPLTRRSFLTLTGEQIEIIASHPCGSHFLCQLVAHPKFWSKTQRKDFYEKLQPFYSPMAQNKAACWFVTQLWKTARTIDEKLLMAQSLSQDLSTLRSHVYAKFIAYEMNLVAFCSRPDQWRRTFEFSLKKTALLDNLDDDQPKKKKIRC